MNEMKADDRRNRPRRFRFTLRKMFVVTAVVALCIGLLIHYGGCVGVLLLAMALCFVYSYFRQDKKGMIVYVVVFTAFWIALQLVGPYTSLRNRVVWVVGTDRLQEWATETLDNLPPADQHGRMLLERERLPEDTRVISGYRPAVIPARNGQEAYISFGHGGGFYQWGLLVGRPGFEPSWGDDYEKIADGIWGYYGE